MTDNSFANDDSNKGTTGFVANTDADNSGSGSQESGNELQHQIDVMQKRMGDKDDFINTLQGENQTLREKMADIEAKVESMGSVEDQIKRMQQAQDSNQDTTLDEDTLVNKVLGSIQAKTEEEKATANFNQVSELLTKTYGADKVDEIVKSAAKENGLSFDDMFALAKKSPQAVYRMIGIKQTSAINPSHNTNVGFNTDTKSKEQKLSDFARLRKDNPKEFYSPEVQQAFRKACLES